VLSYGPQVEVSPHVLALQRKVCMLAVDGMDWRKAPHTFLVCMLNAATLPLVRIPENILAATFARIRFPV
jgi:hypothetical protein